MHDILGESLKKLRWIRIRNHRILATVLALSLIVSVNVFWFLRQPGLTLAGDATCGILEHTHDEECNEQVCVCENLEEEHIHEEVCFEFRQVCEQEEHVHQITCYSDETADVETMLDWQEMFADYPFTGNLREDLVGIAQTQVGYTESELNFEIDEEGNQRGYTRYGAWYGAPYGDWSAMFVSFCLSYAGANPEENPGNTGAASMAETWNQLGKYASAGEYIPKAGDLVFFHDNTVGIVTEVQNATCYVIQGDIDNAVCGDVLSLEDAEISGWGITEVEEAEELEEVIEEVEEASEIEEVTEEPTEDPETEMAYSLRTTSTATQIAPYLAANNGSYFFTLYDHNNNELQSDGNGHYTAYANTGYKLSIGFNSPKGFVPGIYEYQIPDGLKVDGGEGEFILEDGVNVGSWTVSDDGLITIVFNEHMNSRSEILISATLGIHFPEQQDPINFDGKITVTVTKPPEEVKTTKIYKWGSQGAEGTAGKNDPNKLYWTVYIVGDRDSTIPGSAVSDKVISGDYLGDHYYTQEDQEKGLKITVSEPNPNGGNPIWHNWEVKPGDPNLTWTETGWSYEMPATATCWCGQVELGNEGWEYYIEYQSTPERTGVAGALGYMNQASADNQYVDGWAEFNHGESDGEITKRGSFVTDAGGGAFLWEFQAFIPGRQQGQKADYYWYIMDNMDVRDANGNRVGYVTNDAHLSTVTVNYHGTTIQVPRVQDATENDKFAWNNAWSADHGDGVYYGREIELLCRCDCTEENCPFGGQCGIYWYIGDDGQTYSKDFCQCWTETQDLTFTFTYKTKDLSMLDAYGGLGHQLRNEAILYNKHVVSDADPSTVLISDAVDSVPIPGLFDKQLTKDFDGLPAHYRITVNEAKLVLTDGSPLKIHDMMTDTLAYISGSLVITSEDAAGNIRTLQQDVDYTVIYDGTSGTRDDEGNPAHILDITILHPQPVTYILDYDTTLIYDTQATGAVKYKNSATITLWDTELKETTAEKVYADLNISAKTYKVDMYKVCELTGDPLPGATFGLFNEQGGLISSEITDQEGKLHFKTNVTEGIILREHVRYYLQETKAPPGYQLDDTKYWFCFCNKPDATCETCDQILAGADNAFRIPFEQVGVVRASNEPINYYFPATGGTGVYPITVLSIVFIIIPMIYGFVLRRKWINDNKK